jgi:YggT family protein
MSHQSHVRRVGSAYWISRAIILFVYAFAIACIVILAIAFFLQLFNANQTAPFVDWVYRAAKRIMQPFRGIFPSVEGEQGSVFDVSMLFAMFMYGLLALGLHALIAWIDRKIASIRYESMWQPATTSATGQDVVTIPAAAPPAVPAVPAVTSPPPGPPASSEAPPGDRR